MQVVQNVYISLPYITAARTDGIDKNEEITSLSICECFKCPETIIIQLSRRNDDHSYNINVGKIRWD